MGRSRDAAAAPTKVTVWAIVAFVALAIVFLFLAPYARKETVPGYLMPTAGTARVYAPQPGIVSAVQVQEGQEVEGGGSRSSTSPPPRSRRTARM